MPGHISAAPPLPDILTSLPQRVTLAYSPDSDWRNRAELLGGAGEIKAFLRRKWAKSWTIA